MGEVVDLGACVGLLDEAAMASVLRRVDEIQVGAKSLGSFCLIFWSFSWWLTSEHKKWKQMENWQRVGDGE